MTLKPVSKSEFRVNALELLRQVEASGQSLIVTDDGKPVLEVRPYLHSDRNPLDLLRGSVVRYENPTEPVALENWTSMQ